MFMLIDPGQTSCRTHGNYPVVRRFGATATSAKPTLNAIGTDK
jgi:hypothetical protein